MKALCTILFTGVLVFIVILCIIWLPSYLEAQSRIKLSKTITRMHEIEEVLNNIENSRFPRNTPELESLFTTKGEPQGMLIDPYTNRKFIFLSDGSEWKIASPGPDAILNQTDSIEYDPSNGNNSSGDIIRQGRYRLYNPATQQTR